MYNNTVMNTLEFIVLVGAALGAILFIVGNLIKLFKTWFTFVDDWNGSEDRLGIVDRLEEGSRRFDKIEHEIDIIKAELFNNSGSSLRDAVDRIEAAVAKKPAPRKKK